MQVKKQQLELDIEQLTGSKLGKEYIKAVYCYPAYLTSMQSTSYKMSGWMTHKLNQDYMKLRCLLLERTAVTNLDSILESKDITLPTKVHIVKASHVLT